MSIEPFVVQCQTCTSRIRVTDPALVGTIANCPKCNSMIQIEPPTTSPQVAIGNASVDSQALTEESIDAGEEPSDPAAVPSGFENVEGTAPPIEDSPIAPPVHPEWQSETTQRSRQIGLIVALSACSLLGAVLMFGWFIRSWNQGRETADDSQAIASLPDTEPSPDSSSEPDASETSDSADTRQAEQANDPPTSDLEGDGPHDEEVVPKPPVVPNVDEESTATVTTPDVPKELLQDDIFGDPLNPKQNDVDDPDKATLERLPKGLQDLLKTDLDFDDDLEPNLETPPTINDIQVEKAVEEENDPTIVANPPERLNVRRALGIQFALSASNNGEYPLADLLLIVSQITGAPIQIDWVSFDLCGTDIRQMVKVPARELISADELLSRVAVSVGAQVKKDEFMITLSPLDELFNDRIDELVDLSDFPQKASAIAVLNQFLVAESNAKAVQVGEERYQKELAGLAAEALRRMRGVSSKVNDATFRRWAQATSDPGLDWPVVSQGNTLPQLDGPIAMNGLLRRLGRLNDASIYINWQDAIPRRLAPDQLTMAGSLDQPGKTLQSVLRPFKLQARQVDKSHWWIGTEATYDRFPVVAWTDPLGPNPDQAVKDIVQAISQKANVTNVAVDGETQRALLLLPRFIVRQMPKIQNGLNLTRTQ